MKNTSQKFLTMSELAERWRVSKSWLDKAKALTPEQIPPYIKVGRLIRFPLNEVIVFEEMRLLGKDGQYE